MRRNYISNWELEANEIASNCWEGIARRNSGNTVTCQGPDSEEIMRRLEIEFWDIELQLSNNISSLLFTYLSERAAYEGKNFYLVEHSEHFGSWMITKDNRQ